jgi:two-component system cell cycle sensor histidine kinase/response regulator CckA
LRCAQWRSSVEHATSRANPGRVFPAPSLPAIARPVSADTVTGAARPQETILVIDDDDAVRRGLVRLLQTAGFDTLEARDGSEAIHIFAERSDSITAVTLDLEMPTTNGRDTLAMLSEYAPELPIIVATAYPKPDDLLGRQPGERGVGYLQKPFTMIELTAELRRVIDEMKCPDPPPAGRSQARGNPQDS